MSAIDAFQIKFEVYLLVSVLIYLSQTCTILVSFTVGRGHMLVCRQFLWSFRLPGEAQKIDRMMECFAQRYCELNPGVFTSTGTFAAVILCA